MEAPKLENKSEGEGTVSTGSDASSPLPAAARSSTPDCPDPPPQMMQVSHPSSPLWSSGTVEIKRTLFSGQHNHLNGLRIFKQGDCFVVEGRYDFSVPLEELLQKLPATNSSTLSSTATEHSDLSDSSGGADADTEGSSDDAQHKSTEVEDRVNKPSDDN